jgi:hypothetical protein
MSRRHLAVAVAVRPPSNKRRSRRSSRGIEQVPVRQPEPVFTDLEQAFFDSAPSEHDELATPESFDDLVDEVTDRRPAGLGRLFTAFRFVSRS